MALVIIKNQTHKDLKTRSKESGVKLSHMAEVAIRLWLDQPLKNVVVKSKRNGKC